MKCYDVQVHIKLITKLFNTILKLGVFPQDWIYGLIRLITKGNDIYDPDNYRGITLNSCLGKLLCTILYNRLGPIFEKEKVYCREQGGFRKNHNNRPYIYSKDNYKEIHKTK